MFFPNIKKLTTNHQFCFIFSPTSLKRPLCSHEGNFFNDEANRGHVFVHIYIFNVWVLHTIFACSVILKLHMFIQVSPSGWSEGECKGKAGWFPSGYVEKRQRIPTSNGDGEVY